MKMITLMRVSIVIAVIVLTTPVWAAKAKQSTEANPSVQSSSMTHSNSSDLGWQGWGLRAGVTEEVEGEAGQHEPARDVHQVVLPGQHRGKTNQTEPDMRQNPHDPARVPRVDV